MKFLDTLNLLLRLHALINRNGTGTPDNLACRLGISRAAVYRHLQTLEDMDASIDYCRKRQSFYYTEPFELVFYTHTHTHTHVNTQAGGEVKIIRFFLIYSGLSDDLDLSGKSDN